MSRVENYHLFSCPFCFEAAIIPKYLATFGIFLALAVTDVSAQTIYQCGPPGHITLTDQPCDGSHPPPPVKSHDEPGRSSTEAPEAATAAGRSSAEPIGAWRGSAELLLNVSDKPVPVASPNSLSVFIDAHGVITGALREQGCQLSGKLASDYNSSEHAVVLKLSNCREQRLNLNYTGTLSMAPPGHLSRLAVSGFNGFLGGAIPTTASLRSDLRRDATGVSGSNH